MIPAEKIIIALDSTEPKHLEGLYDALKGHKVWIKVGMELFYSQGAAAVDVAHKKGFKVFLDLKLHDIPNTVGQGLKSLLRLPVDMINIHAAGGSEMMKRAAEVVKAVSKPPLLIAVTQLTSTTQEQMQEEQLIKLPLLESVLNYSLLAQKNGCDGVVCSPLEVQSIKKMCGKSFVTVTPGIRPLGVENQDQKRITTPREALNLGTDFMVIGRPITQAKDPAEALDLILQGK